MDELEEIRARLLKKLMSKEEKKMEMPSKPIHVSGDLNDIISKYDVVVVDFWAPWCQPCKIVEPIVEKLAKEMKGKVVFAKVNSDRNRKLAMKYKIMSIPTLLLFKNGRLAARQVGAVPYDMLKAWIGRYI
ncbi:MAG: thioredoxin [Thermoplasmata archaeon]|nr:MAG: thioredoxin [Thermoplasmata archaeon]KAA0008600.1 MAG: thioredoxin [Thermoplasmata archaeon]MCD6573495.1 thioredoxin [Thermoplasmata archaeon]